MAHLCEVAILGCRTARELIPPANCGYWLPYVPHLATESYCNLLKSYRGWVLWNVCSWPTGLKCAVFLEFIVCMGSCGVALHGTVLRFPEFFFLHTVKYHSYISGYSTSRRLIPLANCGYWLPYVHLLATESCCNLLKSYRG